MNYVSKDNIKKTNSFSYKLFIIKNWKNILIIVICAFFYSFGNVVFLVKAASIPSGIGAISITLSYIMPILKRYLTFIYLALNIPLIIIFWFKIKRKFILMTIIFLIFNAIFGYVLGIEVISNFLSDKVFIIIENGNIVNSDGTTEIVKRGWPVFFYIILTLIFCSPSSAIVWKHGASTGGTDIIAHYVSTKKKKEVGLFLMIIGYAMTTFALVLLFLMKKLAPENIASNINGFKYFINIQVVSSFLYIYANGIIINNLYPKYKKVKIKIDSKKHDLIIKWLEESEYWHPYKIIEITSGYTKQKIYTIESIVLLLESDDIINKIKKIDANAWISVLPVTKIYGRFNYSSVE